MSIKIVRNAAGNCINFRGTSNPVHFNSCLSGEVDSVDDTLVNVVNDIQTADTGTTQYEFYNLPYTEFRDASGGTFASAQAVADYITTNGNVAAPEDINVGYKGVFDASGGFDPETITPSIYDTNNPPVNGDWFFINVAGTIGTDVYTINDIIKYSETTDTWQQVKNAFATVEEIEASALNRYDIHVDGDYAGTIRNGSSVHPYTDLNTAISASTAGQSILIKGTITAPVSTGTAFTLPHSLFFYGADECVIKFAIYNATNGDMFKFEGTDNTQEFSFNNITMMNAGGYALLIKKASKVTVEDCTLTNNGWNGTGLSTVAAATGSVLGYDSTQSELQAFYASSNASDGGAMRIEEAPQILIIGNTVTKNLRGIRVQDCGVNGAGFISRNQSTQNIDSGIYLAVGSLNGCQNMTVINNYSAYNANNGTLIVGGLNNRLSQNEINGNWNGGVVNFGSGNLTLRDCGLYDNNRSGFSGIGNVGDAKASIQINDQSSFLATSFVANVNARFIMEVLDTQVHYTGLGSNTTKVGFLIASGMGSVPANEHNIINIDDVGFIGQDYAIDLSEVDITNMQLSVGDCRYQNIGIKAVRAPSVGNYSELPFSNHVTNVASVDVVVDTLKMSISLREGVGGNVINTYGANELQGVIRGTEVDIIQKTSDKIQIRGLTYGNVYVNGVLAGNSLSSMNDTLNAAFTMDLTEYKEFLQSDVGLEVITWYYIESPDGVYVYPLFNNEADAQTIDTAEGGTGTATGFSFPDEPTGATWYGPDTSMVTNGAAAPSNGIYGSTTNVLWNEIPQSADSTAVPTAFSAATVTLDELTALNNQVHPVGATWTTTIQSPPAWITQAQTNGNITGTAPEVHGDSTNFPHTDYTVTVVRTNSYGSSTGTLTVRVTNTNALVSLPGTLHVGSVVTSSATNSAGKVFLDGTNGHLVYDVQTLEDGDKIEWYHQDGDYGFGIVASGIDKTTDLVDHDVDNSSKWDLLAPITGSPTHSNGQNFGNNFSPVWTGMVPLGWDDNTNPQVIPTRPVYAASDVWKLFNNAGTIELSLNGTLFRSSSSTHTDPMITFAIPAQAGSGSATSTSEMPSFVHTANAAVAPTGFTLLSGTMDTSDKLNGDSAVSVDNLTLSPGQRFIATKAWWNTNVLPFLDGASGEDNKVFLGVAKDLAGFDSIVEQDFYASHRVENQTVNLTKITQYYAGPTPSQMNINRSSDTDVHYNMAIEFTREGDLVTMRSPDTDPSLTTEPVGGTFGQTQTWTGAHATVGTGAQNIVLATKEAETRAKVVETGLSVITAPSKPNEFDVTENGSNLPLFNGDVAANITLNAGQTYKFWLHSDTIESTDTLEICLISDNSTYTTGVTTSGTPGSFGAYVEFAIPADVPPVKFKWTSGAVAYYATPVISGSTYSAGVTGITLEGPSANQTGTNLADANDHGWLSIDEPLGAGQRLVLSGAFLYDVADAMAVGSLISFGTKDGSWANTISGVIPPGFEGGMRISLYRAGTNNFQLYGYNGDTSTATAIVGGLTVANLLNYNAFLEITSSGNNIRLGYALTSTSDATTVPYADFHSTTKIQSGDKGYGISTIDVMVQSMALSNPAATDASDIDWTALSEIAVPAASTILTDWDKTVDFSGGNEHLKQVSSSAGVAAVAMVQTSALVSAGTAGYTSSDGTARPWATAIVFKSDRHNSNQHIWNQGEGTATNNDNIFLRHTAAGELIFGWAREGVGKNECTIGTVNSSDWYGVYIAHKGARYNASNATAANLADAFDIRIMSSSDSFNSVGSNLSIASNWTSTGNRMDRSVAGDFTIGGRGSNRNFHGKVGSMVVTTLKLNDLMADDTEIKKMITDPTSWVNNYKIGNSYGHYASGGNLSNFQITNLSSAFATQVWLMGDGTNDSYANGIRNQISSTDQNYGKLQFNNMVSSDIETVTIPGLT